MERIRTFGVNYIFNKRIQIGNLSQARKIFEKVEKYLGLEPNEEIDPEFSRSDIILTNRAMLMVGEGDFITAMKLFTDLVSRFPAACTAINNLGVCQLLAGNVGQGASFIENLIVDNPAIAGTCEALIMNLSSMYDLTERTAEKKRRLLKMMAKVCGDDFDCEVLRM